MAHQIMRLAVNLLLREAADVNKGVVGVGDTAVAVGRRHQRCVIAKRERLLGNGLVVTHEIILERGAEPDAMNRLCFYNFGSRRRDL